MEVSAGRDADENDDSATLRHTASGGAYDGVTMDLPVTVRDGLRISIDDAEGVEGGYMSFRVHLSKPSPGGVRAQWFTHTSFPQTADPGSDYDHSGGEVVFDAGEQEKHVRVWLYEDGVNDPWETLEIWLLEPVGAILSDPVDETEYPPVRDRMTPLCCGVEIATGRIRQTAPDPAPVEVSLSAARASVAEGGSVRIAATLAKPLEADWNPRIPLVYRNGTAESSDYEGPSELTIFFASGSEYGHAKIDIAEDADSDDETFTVSFGELPRQVRAGASTSVELTVIDNDGVSSGLSGLTVSVADATAYEGREDLEFAVTLNRPAPSPVTVSARFIDGTATGGQDFLGSAESVEFAAGERLKWIRVQVTDDAIDEGVETMTVELTGVNPDAVTISRATATGRIRNSDPMPRAWLARFGRAVAEQSLEGITSRIRTLREAGRAPGFQGTIGGRSIGGGLEDCESGGGVANHLAAGASRPGANARDAERDPSAEEDNNAGVNRDSEAMGGDSGAGPRCRQESFGSLLDLPPGALLAMSGTRGFGGTGAFFQPAPGVGNGMAPASGRGMPGFHNGAGQVTGGMGSSAGFGANQSYGPGQAYGSGIGASTVGTGSNMNMGTGAGMNSAGSYGEMDQGRRLQQLLLDSSFEYTRNEDEKGGVLGFWGRGAQNRFGGADGALQIDGEVYSAMLGADYLRGDWLYGLAISETFAEGGYRGLANSDGGVESTLTAAIPYAAWQGSEKLSLWGAAGYGTGELRLDFGNSHSAAANDSQTAAGPGSGAIQADLDWAMAAAGLRGELFGDSSGGGPALALISDALWAHTASSRALGMMGADASVSRLRLGVEGSWSLALASGGITPKLEAGLRHDGGDAETGFGVEVGGGLAWNAPELGLTLDIEARALLAHEAEGRSDRGLSASLSWSPAPEGGFGPKFSLRQEIGGQSSGGLDALFRSDPIADFASGQGAGARWTAETSWGMPMFRERYRGEPVLGYSVTGHGRDYSLGWQLEPLDEDAPDLRLNFKLNRRESPMSPPDHGIGIEVNLAW